jgi:nitrate/TMAO reductase-like tetraheme cytochrome c subunit
MASIKKFLAWCKRHLLLVTILSVIFLIVFTLVNIQILHKTSEPEFCEKCHPGQGVGPLAEVDSWRNSAHYDADVSCLDCHGRPGVAGYIKAKMGGLKDLYLQLALSKEEKLEILSNPHWDLVPDYHCLFCHSDESNQQYRAEHKYTMKIVNMRMLDGVKNPEFRKQKGLPDIMTDSFVGGTHFSHELHIESFEYNCRDCHLGVVHQPGTKTDRMNMCVECHLENEGSDGPLIADCQACHEAQYDMNEGTGAKGVAGEASLMYAEDVGCEDCHTEVEDGVFRPSSETCVNCHDDEYTDIFDEWAEETIQEVDTLKELRAKVEFALLDADKHKRDTKEYWEIYQKALYNFKLVRNDGTNGVHNNEYTQDILKSIHDDFNKIQQELGTKQ